MKLSILTATYNREKYLSKLYESIKENMKYNIIPEWIIVDDGSTDNTKDIVQGFINEQKVEIKYFFQENKGKMSAINKAVEIATGDFIVDCDSDDFFTEDAFKIIEQNADFLLQNYNLYGMIFLKKENDGTFSGKEFKENNKITTMLELYFKDDVQGEKIIVYNSKIRKLFFHELEKGEKFITESRMYHKMDENYKLITINKAVEQGSYVSDGYTKNINQTFIKNPYGYYMYFKEILQKNLKDIKWSKKLYVIKHYILFGYLTNSKFDDKIIYNKINKIIYRILYLPGIIKSKKYKKGGE